MPLKERTLEEMIAQSIERLAAQKLASDANISKMTKRAEEATDETEKKRLEDLVKLHTDYRASLDTVDATAEATKRWNDLQEKIKKLPSATTE
jgi:hypothetical protein